MKPLVLDRSRHDDNAWYGLGQRETEWRTLARSVHREYGGVLPPEIEGAMDNVYAYRYLEPEHLHPPWTPALLRNIRWVKAVVDCYVLWDAPGEMPRSWWDGPDTSDLTLPTGERVFQIAIRTFGDAGLTDWVARIEGMRDCYRRRVAWRTSEVAGLWKPFQVDINSPSLFLDVIGPDVWQVIVDALTNDETVSWRGFLKNMRMADLEYVVKEIPGHHGNPFRRHLEDMPLGYGTSTTMPSFGYRREHRSEILFAGWAAATMPGINLFDEKLWVPS